MSWGSSWLSPSKYINTSTNENSFNNNISGFLPECETPQSQSDYVSLARRTVQKIIEYEKESNPNIDIWIDYEDGEYFDSSTLVSTSYNNNRWVPIGSGYLYEDDNDDGNQEMAIQMMEKPDESGFSCIKTVGIMPCPPQVLLDVLWWNDIKERQKWDPDLQDMRVVSVLSPDLHVVYRSYRAPVSMVAPRDFVALNGKFATRNGSYISFGTSINHKDVKTNSRFVRANIILTGFLIEPIGDGTLSRCTRFVHLDPKGMIPSWVMNAGKKRAGQSFFTLRNLVKQQLPTLLLKYSNVSNVSTNVGNSVSNKENNFVGVDYRDTSHNDEEKSDTHNAAAVPVVSSQNIVNSHSLPSLHELNTNFTEHSTKDSLFDKERELLLEPSVKSRHKPSASLPSLSSLEHKTSVTSSMPHSSSLVDAVKKGKSVDFPLPKISSEEFHRQQQQQKQQKLLKEQELLDKLSKRQQIKQHQQSYEGSYSGSSSPVMSYEVEKLVGNLNDSLRGLQLELQQNTEQIRVLELSLARERMERERILAELKNPTGSSTGNNPRVEGTQRIGWDMVGFALVWPFVTYAVVDYIQSRRKR